MPPALKIVSLLAAALLCACAGAPPQPAPVKVPVRGETLQVRGFTLHAPAQGADLLEALDAFSGQPLSPELSIAVEAYVRDYYGWLEWRNIRVLVDSVTDAEGSLHIIVAGDAPADLPPLPVALAEVPEPAADGPAVPAPNEPGGAKIETALDDSFRPWLQTASRVLIDASEKRLYLKHDGGHILSYAVAVGTPRTPTPPGSYTVEAIRYQPTWYPPASIRREYERKGKTLAAAVPPGAHNPLGDWFVRLQNGIGIHGTNQPRSIGRAVSHGCIRMHDRDVAELTKTLRRGDGITIVRSRGALTATQVAR